MITIGTTPNPDARLFTTPRTLISSNGYLEVTPGDADRADLPVLCRELVALPFVRRVFVMNNFVTVVRAASARWSDIEEEIERTIEAHLDSFDQGCSEAIPDVDIDDPTFQQVFDAYLAPAIAVDGGAIRFHSFDGDTGVVTVDALGSCHGCPSLVNTLERGIKPMLSELFPQVSDVVFRRTDVDSPASVRPELVQLSPRPRASSA